MKQIILTEEEAMIIIRNLSGSYVPQQDEKKVYELINRMKMELGVE